MTRTARALAASLLGLVLVGLTVSGTALAASGPLWYHREVGGKGIGAEISKAAPETVQGEGGKQALMSEISSTKIEIVAPKVLIEGEIYNNANQGQSELELKYNEPKLAKPELKECKAKIGENNAVKVFGHLAWKWNGEAKQLEEEATKANQSPEWIFLAKELETGAKGLPKEQFTTISLSGSGCGVLAGKFSIRESEAGEIKPGLGYSASQTVTTSAGQKKVHFWNGTKFIGVETGLTFASNPADLAGENTVKALKQEVGIFENSMSINVEPTEVKFGNSTTASRTVVYSNEGSTEWVVPTLIYNLIEGKGGSVTRTNECAGKTIKPGESCDVVLKYSVATPENYSAEIELLPAMTVTVKAEA